MNLTLIRHAQTPSNVLGLLDTAAPGAGLTELGFQQAATLANTLDSRPIDGIYFSTRLRTALTAAPLAAQRGLEAVELPGIHEISAGDLEMRGDRDALLSYLGALRAWHLEGLHVGIPGGEDGTTFFERFDADVAAVAEKSERPVLFSHGAAIRVWVFGRAANVTDTETIIEHLDNTGIVELEGDPESGWRLLRWQGEQVP